MKFTRREIITHLRNIIGGAGLYPLLPSSAQAAQEALDDEHYFIFVELKGGIHHALSTDCPDFTGVDANAMLELPLDAKGILDTEKLMSDADSVAQQQDEDKLLTTKDKLVQIADSTSIAHVANGYFAALPPQAASGNTSTHYPYRLGWSGAPLVDHVNKLGVLRGVYMQGTFHGPANNEIYSGEPDGKPHVAGVLARLLTERYEKKKPLDNLVLDGAAYTTGDGTQAPIKVPFYTLSEVATKIDSSAFSLNHAKNLLDAMQRTYNFAGSQAEVVKAYLDAFGQTEFIKQNFRDSSDLQKGDISLDLGAQLSSALSLFRNKMARVVTICTGAPTPNNNVPGFGLYDAHGGLYAKLEGRFERFDKAMPHSKVLRDTMQAISNFIKSIESGNNSEFKDKLTVVISSEYGRNNNFAGSEIDVDEEMAENIKDGQVGSLGNGHYFPNNNYIFYGKNVQGGVWLGKSDPVTRFPHCVDFEKLNSIQPGETKDQVSEVLNAAFKDPLDDSSKKAGSKIAAKSGFVAGDITFDPNSTDAGKGVTHQVSDKKVRSLMAKDAVCTIMHIAGYGDKHAEYYETNISEEFPAKPIKRLIKPQG